MGIKNQDGFTIIELSLFFAVSGLLLLTMLSGVGLAVQRQRFTDAVNSTQSFLQQQYNETQITLNDRGNASDCDGALDAKGASNCLVIGKLIDLGIDDPSSTGSTINTHRVIVDQDAADANARLNTPLNEIDALNSPAYKTTVINNTNNDQRYGLAWGATLHRIRDSEGSDSSDLKTNVRYILLLRSTTTGLISTYKIDTTSDFFGGGSLTELLGGAGTKQIKPFAGTENQAIKACIRTGDIGNATALLTIKDGGSQDAVMVGYDANADSWCNGL